MKKIVLLIIVLLPFFSFTVKGQNPKRLLVDDLTASFCGHCPCMDTMLHKVIMKKYTGTIIMAFHGSSSMYYREKMEPFILHLGPWGSPAAIPDRRCTSQFIPELSDSVDAIYSRIPQASVKLEIMNRTWDPSKRELKFNLKATATEPGLVGLFRINVALIEQNLIGLQWFVVPECGPNKEDLNYNHLNVVRDILFPWEGDSLIGPDWPQMTSVERSFTMILDSAVVPGNCEFVVYVDKKGPNPDSLYLCPIQQAEKQTVTGSLGMEPGSKSTPSVLSVFPNPSKGVINVHVRLNSDSRTKIILYDPSGKQVRLSGEQTVNEGDYNFEFRTDGLKPGIYFLVVNNAGSKVQKKIIID
jgi:hypothetical protein